jgi:hypothetical protein
LQRAIYELNKIADNYNLKISVTKTKTMAFKGKHLIRTKIVINDTILEQVSHLKYLGSDISNENNKDIDEKVAKFRHICGSTHRNVKNKTRKDTRIKFYETIAVPTLMHASETRVMRKKKTKTKFKAPK